MKQILFNRILKIELFSEYLIFSYILASVADNYYNWYNIPKFTMATWSILATTPLAIIVFLHSRTDIPPFYHPVRILPCQNPFEQPLFP